MELDKLREIRRQLQEVESAKQALSDELETLTELVTDYIRSEMIVDE